MTGDARRIAILAAAIVVALILGLLLVPSPIAIETIKTPQIYSQLMAMTATSYS